MWKGVCTLLIPCSILLAGCGGREPSPLGALGKPSLSDSLIYYSGLLEGAAYLNEAAKDTSLHSYEARSRYLKGLNDGLRAVDEVNDTYNVGLQKGIELALRLYKYNAEYGIDLNRNLLYQSIAYVLEGDGVLNEAATVKEFETIVERLDFKKREQMVKNMHLSLAEEGARLKMKKLSDDLYVTDANPGSGPLIQRGDLIFATLNYILESGRNLEMPSSQQLMVGGPTMPEVMIRVYTRMRKGGSAQYATTAFALFGNHAAQIGLKPEEVVLMSVEISNVVNPGASGKREVIAL